MGSKQSIPRERPYSVLDEESLEDNSTLPPYFIRAITALYKEISTTGGMEVRVFVEQFQGRLKLSKELNTFLECMFVAYDENADKLIDLRELIMMLEILLTGDKHAKISGVFRMCDRSEDGVIDKKELVAFMKSLSCIVDTAAGETSKGRKKHLEELANDIFKQFDTDGDNMLSTDEFTKGCLRHDAMLVEVNRVTTLCVGCGF